MLKKSSLKLLFGIACLLILLVGYLFWKNTIVGKDEFHQVFIRGHAFEVETVATKSAKQKGLGGRESICSDCGMLFLFDKPGRYAFWMKDMQFALDILWLSDKKIVFVEKNVSPEFAGTMMPSADADQVLELNAGTVDKFGITAGDSVSIR